MRFGPSSKESGQVSLMKTSQAGGTKSAQDPKMEVKSLKNSWEVQVAGLQWRKRHWEQESSEWEVTGRV